MPAFGLVKDSPFIYYAQKAARASKIRGSRAGRNAMHFSFTFEKLVIFKPVLNYELNDPNSSLMGRHMRFLSRKIVLGAKQQVGINTGRLRRSIHSEHFRIGTGQGFRVGSNVDYALMHHEGTRPHIITPKPGNEVLRFGRGSRVIQVREVRHPGTKANRYLSDQLRIHVR